MIPTSVTYTRRQEVGIGTEEISVTVELNKPGDESPSRETADAAFKLAKRFVLSKLERGQDPAVEAARRVLSDTDMHYPPEIRRAQELIAKLPPEEEIL